MERTEHTETKYYIQSPEGKFEVSKTEYFNIMINKMHSIPVDYEVSMRYIDIPKWRLPKGV